MTARRRAPRTPEQRQAQAVRAMAPGTLNGTVANAAPVRLTQATVRAAGGKKAASAGLTLWVGPSAPTDGSLLWYDTDDTC